MRTKFTGALLTFILINGAFLIGVAGAGLITFFIFGVGALPVALWQIGWNIQFIINNIEIEK